MYTLTIYNKCQHCDPILAVVSVLNTYIAHEDQLYLNGFDILCTVHEQDSVVVRLERTSYLCAIACILCST